MNEPITHGLRITETVIVATFDNTSNLLATVSDYGTIIVWDPESFE